MSEGSSPKRSRMDFDDSAKEDHHEKYNKIRDQDDQGSCSTSRKRRADTDDDDMKECDEIKSKNVGGDAARREHTLVIRLTNKEQELQECMNQIQEMKQAQTQNTAQLRSMLLDPAINLVFQRMSKEMDEHKEKLKQKQNELNAWKFTPDSQTGMRLMGKCRMLLQENGELGKIISSGRTAKLEGEISLHKALVGEMKKNQKELDEFVGELEEDVEGMQGMIFMLQQQLKEAREQITHLQQENEQLRTLQLPSEPDPGGVVKNRIGVNEPMTLVSSTSTIKSSYNSADHFPESKPSNSLLVSNMLIPLASPSDSAGPAPGSPRDSSPSHNSLKVAPDSGVQTQEDEEEDVSTLNTNSPSGNDIAEHNPEQDDRLSQSEAKSLASSKISSDNHLEDCVKNSAVNCKNNESQDDVLRTSINEKIDSSANHSVLKSNFHERTSPTAVDVTNTNGDIGATTNEDSDSLDNGLEQRTHLNEEVQSHCVKEEDKLDLKLTPITEKSDSKKYSCLEQESLQVNSVDCNLTNGSVEDVTSSMDTN